MSVGGMFLLIFGISFFVGIPIYLLIMYLFAKRKNKKNIKKEIDVNGSNFD